MASKKERVGYIVEWCKSKLMPSESCIAILCNIRAETGDFNPKTIEQGQGAPPYTRPNVGYGIMQFSDYPQNQQLYTHCKNLSDKEAIVYQLNLMWEECTTTNINKLHWFKRVHNGVNYNLSFKEFYTNSQNKSAQYLTFAFQWEYLRPGTDQDRYTLFINEIKSLYDFSKYDKNGGQNTTTDPNKPNGYTYPPFAFDCGGKPIIPKKDENVESKPKPKPTPGGSASNNNGKITPKVKSATDYLEKWAKKGSGGGFNDGYGYQCVALMEHYLKMCDNSYIRGPNGHAWEYVNHFKTIANGRKKLGLSPSKWVKATPPYQKGDALAYSREAMGTVYGHVAIARNATQRYGQNEAPPWDWTNKIYIVPIGKPTFAIRKIKD